MSRETNDSAQDKTNLKKVGIARSFPNALAHDPLT